MAQRLSGPTTGLKSQEKHALTRIYRRHVPPEQVITVELARFMAEISRAIRRQVGVLIDRRGRIQHVVVGNNQSLFLPDLGRNRAGRGRFRGLRLIHTHIQGEGLSRDDLTDLSLLRLDLVGVIQVSAEGDAESIELGHLLPPSGSDDMWEVMPPQPLEKLDIPFLGFIEDLESQFIQERKGLALGTGTTAIAVHVTTGSRQAPQVQQSLQELEELALTAGVEIVETVIQRRRNIDPKYVLGRGKLDNLVLASMQQDVDLIIFDRDLSATQAKAIAHVTELKVLDRTQLILDIFAGRATSRTGKLQVELAQLRYMLPRLAGKGTAMSRLAGGIGGRGPGETKLEMDRRRAKDRINRLQAQIQKLAQQRAVERSRRIRSGTPIAALIGYTNAGKSTLLNALTGSEVLAEDKLFATLDPTARKCRPFGGPEVILTDTVGFIRDLPEDLVTAFKATLEELDHADVLLHIVDIATPGFIERIAAVEQVLEDLELNKKKRITVFNKSDGVDDTTWLENLCRQYRAVPISALSRATLHPFAERLADALTPN